MDIKLYGMLKSMIDAAGITDVNELKADIDELYSLLAGKVSLIGETTTPLQDQDTTNPILINGVPTEAVSGNLVIYNTSEFVYDGTKWILVGDMGVLGALAYKNSALATYTPAGSVSAPAFTGNELSMSTTFTPSGSVSAPTFSGTEVTLKPKVTAAGTVSKPDIVVTPFAKTVTSIADVGTLPSLITTVADETLKFTFYQGTLPTKESPASVLAWVTAELSYAPIFTGTQVEGSVVYTPSGTVSQPTFSGNQGSINVSGTPSGTVSQPVFTGTQTTIVSE